MVTKNPETPKESELTEFMDAEATLKAEISDPGLDEVMYNVRINAKAPDNREIATMEKYDIASEWVTNLAKLVTKHYELINSIWTLEEWNNLQKQPEYIATMQATLNILNQPCRITGTYDSETQESLENFVKERTGKSTVLNSEWYLSRSNKLVLVNALIHPNDIEKAKKRTTTNFSSLEYDLKTWLKNTNWNLKEWEIKLWGVAYNNPGLKRNYPYRYPTWTHNRLRTMLPEDEEDMDE